MKRTRKQSKVIALLAAFTVMCNMSFANEYVLAAETDDEFVIEDTMGSGSDTDVDYTEQGVEEDYEGDDVSDEDWDESEIELSDDELTLKIGAQQVLEITGDYDEVTWSSSRASVVKVDSDGVVTGVKAGTATIYAEVSYTVYNEDDASESDEYDYYIESCNEEEEEEDEESYPLDEDCEDDVDSEEEEDWDGESEGEIYSVTLECQVTVTSNVKLSATQIKLKVGKSKKIKVYGATSSVKWSSKKKKVATVSNTGVVTAVKKGKTTVTAKVNGKILKCKVTVKK